MKHSHVPKWQGRAPKSFKDTGGVRARRGRTRERGQRGCGKTGEALARQCSQTENDSQRDEGERVNETGTVTAGGRLSSMTEMRAGALSCSALTV